MTEPYLACFSTLTIDILKVNERTSSTEILFATFNTFPMFYTFICGGDNLALTALYNM